MHQSIRDFFGKWKRLRAQYAFRRAPIRTIISLLEWRVRCSLQRAVVIQLPRWRLHVLLPAKWQSIGRSIFVFREYYEPELEYLQKILLPGATFVDVGANLGIYTLVASRIVGCLGRVIAFEPSAQSFPLLQKNIVLNSLTNVRAFHAALSEEQGTVRLYHAPCCSSGNSLAHDPSFPESFENVTAETLDDLLQPMPGGRVDLIKMDVQGAEELVLRGARKVLASMKPAIVFEFWPAGAVLLGLSPYGAWDLLEALGYKFFSVCYGGSMYPINSPPTESTYANVLAIHQEKLRAFL